MKKTTTADAQAVHGTGKKKKITVSFAVTVTLNFPDVHIWKCHKMSWHKLLYFVFCRKGEQ